MTQRVSAKEAPTLAKENGLMFDSTSLQSVLYLSAAILRPTPLACGLWGRKPANETPSYGSRETNLCVERVSEGGRTRAAGWMGMIRTSEIPHRCVCHHERKFSVVSHSFILHRARQYTLILPFSCDFRFRVPLKNPTYQKVLSPLRGSDLHHKLSVDSRF